MDQHKGGEWLTHDTKRRKDNQLQKALNSPVEYPKREFKHDIKESASKHIQSNIKENVQGRKHSGICASAEPELLRYRQPKV